MSAADLDKLVYGGKDDDEPQYLVVHPGTSAFARNQLISLAELVSTEGSGLEVDAGVPALRRRLSELELPAPDSAVAVASPWWSFLNFFARERIRPEWVCLTTVPLPGKDIRDAEVTATTAKLLKIAVRFEKLKAWQESPRIILDNEQRLLQRAFEDFYWAVKQSLRRLAGH